MTFEDKIKNYKDYIILKLNENDYHAIIDAAYDMRILEAVQRERERLNQIEIENEALTRIEDY